jgi:trehalose synthase
MTVQPIDRLEVAEVPVDLADPRRFLEVLNAEQASMLSQNIERARRLLDGRRIWNINSTAHGGGVAELLTTLLPYARGAGVDARWLVIDGDDRFFTITKRIHNRLHGMDGDGEGLSDSDRHHYESILSAQANQLFDRITAEDIVILHDPQTAGLIPHVRATGVGVIWRCHVGIDSPNAIARETWSYLLPFVGLADRYVFSRRAYAWDSLDAQRLRVVSPSIDPFSDKNRALDARDVAEILDAAGILRIVPGEAADSKSDAQDAGVNHAAVVLESEPLDPAAPMVVQISRWDRLKDPLGVMDGFVTQVLPRCDAQLLLAGPNVQGVDDDPEGAEVYAEVAMSWQLLAPDARRRVHLACLPMQDEHENAVVVNALQRRADIIVQKSLAEGFGLTVAEAMWKSRPVVASGVGGIRDQIEDGVSGLLLDDPRDPEAFGAAVCSLLEDTDRCLRIGSNAHARVAHQFLGSRHLGQYVDICADLL